MKSMVWTGPRQFDMVEVTMPVPASGELLLEVSMVGICGSDLSGYLGENSLRKPPLVMGHEFSATVVDMAKDVIDWRVGERVTVNPLITCGGCRACRNGNAQQCQSRKIIGIHRPGAFAEYVTVPSSACWRMERDLEASLVEPLACAVRANTQAGIELGDSVIVFGAGIIGLMSVRIAEKMGASRRIVVDTNNERLSKAADWGATDLFNPKVVSLKEEVLRLCPDGVDKAIDAVGVPQTRVNCIDVLRPRGRVVFIGLHNNETTIPGNVVVRQETEIVGSFCYSDEDFRRALGLLQDGSILPTGDWLDVRPLSACQASFEEQIFGPAAFPKIVLQVR